MQRRISSRVLAACEQFGPAVALADGVREVSYADFGAAIRHWSELFAEQPGLHRIGFALPNSIAYVAAIYGAIEAGRVPFLMDDSLSWPEIRAIAKDVALDAVAFRGHEADAAPTQQIGCFSFLTGSAVNQAPTDSPRLRHDTGICRFTSGTSGRPKCLEFSHDAVIAAAGTWYTANALTERDVVVCLSGFYNGLAFNTSLAACFLAGARLAVYKGWASPSQVLRYAASQAATRLVGFPVFYQMIVRAGTRREQFPASLTHFYSAASPLVNETREILARDLGLNVINYYGVAETGPVTYEPDPARAEANGVPLPGCVLRVGAGGLEVRTPYMASGYLNLPGSFEERLTTDGYYRTADIGELSAGRLTLGARSDGHIDIGGKKFDPIDVVEALRGITGIEDAFVFSREGRGARELCAVVATRGEHMQADIRQSLRESLAGFKIPQRIRCIKALPRNSAGKLCVPEIRALFEKETDE